MKSLHVVAKGQHVDVRRQRRNCVLEAGVTGGSEEQFVGPGRFQRIRDLMRLPAIELTRVRRRPDTGARGHGCWRLDRATLKGVGDDVFVATDDAGWIVGWQALVSPAADRRDRFRILEHAIQNGR